MRKEVDATTYILEFKASNDDAVEIWPCPSSLVVVVTYV
jgi:hypothetical protein